MMTKRLAFIQAIDGAGKSYAADQAAVQLSEVYPRARIHVADSAGLSSYRAGERTARHFSTMEGLEPTSSMGSLNTAAHLVGFTVARRLIDTVPSDLLISVRDSHRIEPAIYSGVYWPRLFSHISPSRRFAFFDKLTVSQPAQMIVHLEASLEAVEASTHGFEGPSDPHETAEKLEIVAHELPVMLVGYQKLCGSEVQTIEALTPQTTDAVAAALEPLLRQGEYVTSH